MPFKRIGVWCLLLVIGTAGASFNGDVRAETRGSTGIPVIGSETPSSATIAGGELVAVYGVNFTPDLTASLGDAEVTDLAIQDSSHLTFHVPPQKAPGMRTLTLRNSGGFDQETFRITPTPLAELAPCSITTVAGGLPNVGDRRGRDSGAVVISPNRVAIDANRNVFVADPVNHRIRRIDSASGTTWTVAGCGRSGYDGDGVQAVTTALEAPQGVAIDAGGNIYVTDTGNNRIRLVDGTTGVITTIAGTGVAGFSGDGGPSISAEISGPDDIATDVEGDIYFSDLNNARVRRIDVATGIITTIAGGGPCDEVPDDGGPATSACLVPGGICIDGGGNLVLCDQLARQIRRVDRNTGIISTVAGSAQGQFGDFVNGPALETRLADPFDVAVDTDGSIVLADGTRGGGDIPDAGAIRRVDPLTGWMSITVSDAGYVSGVSIDDASNVYYASVDQGAIRVISSSSGLVADFVENTSGAYPPGYGARATECVFGNILDVASDAAGNLYVLEGQVFANYMVNRIDGATGATERVVLDLDPYGLYGGYTLTVDRTNHVFIGEDGFFGPNLVRRAVPSRVGSRVVVGGGSIPVAPGRKGTKVSLDTISDLAVDSKGSLYIATYGQRLVKYNTDTRRIERVYGLFGQHVAVDASDRLYLSQGHTVFAVRNGETYGIAGNGTVEFSGDGGPATAAGFEFIAGIGFDHAGNLFILTGSRVRRVDRVTGIVTTVAGGSASGYTGDGGSAADALLDEPSSLTVDASGNIYVGSYAGTVRAIRAGCSP